MELGVHDLGYGTRSGETWEVSRTLLLYLVSIFYDVLYTIWE